MGLNEAFFFAVTFTLIVTLIYRIFYFMDFTQYKFWESLLREFVVLIIAGLCFALSFTVFGLNINTGENIYVLLHPLNTILFALIGILEIAYLILCFKPLMRGKGLAEYNN